MSKEMFKPTNAQSKPKVTISLVFGTLRIVSEDYRIDLSVNLAGHSLEFDPAIRDIMLKQYEDKIRKFYTEK